MEKAAFEHLLLTSMANRASRKDTKRFKSGRLVTFVLGLLIAIFMVNAEVRAMSLGAPVPNGVGFSIKIPLNGLSTDTESTEFHMYSLHNRTKTLRVEAPVHGRFARIKIARMKYIARFSNKSGRSSSSNSRIGVRSGTATHSKPRYRRAAFSLATTAGNSAAVAPPAHYSMDGPVTASGMAAHEDKPASRSIRVSPAAGNGTVLSKREAGRMARMLAKRYAKMRESYLRLRKQSPQRARKAYRQLMKFYEVAQAWQRHAN